jgi:hypothetical protein
LHGELVRSGDKREVREFGDFRSGGLGEIGRLVNPSADGRATDRQAIDILESIFDAPDTLNADARFRQPISRDKADAERILLSRGRPSM